MAFEPLRIFTMQYDQLHGHLIARGTHHRERSDKYRAKADALDQEAKAEMADLEGDEALQAKVSNSYGKRSSEREQAREDSKRHARSALQFDWMADHLDPAAEIRLTLGEAQSMELVV